MILVPMERSMSVRYEYVLFCWNVLLTTAVMVPNVNLIISVFDLSNCIMILIATRLKGHYN